MSLFLSFLFHVEFLFWFESQTQSVTESQFWSVADTVQIVLHTHDLFIIQMKSSPQFASPFSLSLSSSSSCLLSHTFYLWQNCPRYHVQTLSRNYIFFFFFFLNTHCIFICCSVSSISLAVLSEVKHCCAEEMYNDALGFIPNTTAVVFNFIYPLWHGGDLELMWRTGCKKNYFHGRTNILVTEINFPKWMYKAH